MTPGDLAKSVIFDESFGGVVRKPAQRDHPGFTLRPSTHSGGIMI